MSNSKLTWFLLGSAAAAAVFFLSSKSGQQKIGEIKSKLKEGAEQLADRLQKVKGDSEQMITGRPGA
jgi:hypothetical protein